MTLSMLSSSLLLVWTNLAGMVMWRLAHELAADSDAG